MSDNNLVLNNNLFQEVEDKEASDINGGRGRGRGRGRVRGRGQGKGFFGVSITRIVFISRFGGFGRRFGGGFGRRFGRRF